MLSFYNNITVSLGENIGHFKISDGYLFRGDLFIEKSTWAKTPTKGAITKALSLWLFF